MFSSAYREERELEDLDGIYAVSVSECSSQQLPYIDDGGEGEHSAYHVSIDFTNFLGASGVDLTHGGRRRAKELAKFATAQRLGGPTSI
jgi:hypothetical protein